jgi:FKBP-type peptidyl-prolyl cis-trans isomerase 2
MLALLGFRVQTRVLLVAAIALIAVLAAACGGGDGESDPVAPTSTSTATPTATATVDANNGSGGEDGDRVAKNGDRVSVHYTGTLDSGEQFDSSSGRDPLAFQVGAGAVIVGFDEAVLGLAVGESVTVRIPPDRAYGERTEDAVVTFDREEAPDDIAVGQQVSVGGRPGVVTEVTDTQVVVDINHQLAGQTLTFEIELLSIDSPG